MRPYIQPRNLLLPPRKPKGSIGNYKRVLVAAAANHQAKVARMSDRWRAKHKAEGCDWCKVRVRFKNGV